MAACPHCKTEPVVRRVQTSLLGTRPVDLALCDCDVPRCQAEGGCGKPLRNVPMHAHRCPHCAARLQTKVPDLQAYLRSQRPHSHDWQPLGSEHEWCADCGAVRRCSGLDS